MADDDLNGMFAEPPAQAAQPVQDEDLNSMFGEGTAPTMQQAPEAQGMGLLGRFKQDVRNRSNNIADIQKKYEAGERGAPFGLLTTAGQVAGIPADAAMEAGKSAWSVMPDAYTKPTEQVANDIANSKTGQATKGFLQRFSKNHPDITEGVGAIGNVIGAIPGVGAGEKVAAAGIDLGAPVVKGIAKAPGKAIAGMGEGAETLKYGWNARSADQLDEVVNNTRQSAGTYYNQMKAKGAVISPQASSNIINNIKSAVANNGLILPETHPKTFATLQHIANQPANGAFGLEGLDLYRRLLGDVATDTDAKGFLTADAQAALTAKNALDASVNKLGRADLINGDPTALDALKKGRAQWAQAGKFDDITRIIKKADGDPNKIKTGFSRLLDNKKNLYGYSKEELALIKNASKNTTTEGLLKFVGKFGVDFGSGRNIGNSLLPALELLSGGVKGIPFVAAGTAAKEGQRLLAKGKAERVLQAIENRPLPSHVAPNATTPVSGAITNPLFTP